MHVRWCMLVVGSESSGLCTSLHVKTARLHCISFTKESINDDFRWHNSSEAPTVTVKTSLHCISPARASMMASDGTTPPTVMYDNSSPV
ncbi:hypothetical protein DY000_02042056 [Brassica cretica]|uniref:Secreted protein n=1 Tax=Brassica cretica TaxID=69181 RepID=A0ABQ7B771_BRACR|nr:hypothetical protein DY000_02042056 [Brassica cretica]